MTEKSLETTIKELLVPHTTKQISVFQRLITLLERSENVNYEEDIHQIISTYLENRNPELQISTLYILITCLKKGLFLSDKYMDIAYKVVNIAYNTDTDDVENQELCFKAYSALEVMDNLHLQLYKTRTMEMAKILQKIITSGASSLQKLNALKMLNKLVQNTDFKTDKNLQNILVPLWFGQICPMVFNISQQNLQNSSLELSLSLLPMLQDLFLNDTAYFTNFTGEIERKYLPIMIDLVSRENNLFAKLWIFLSKLLGATFARRFGVVNMLLTVIEQAFKSTNIDIRMQAYYCWQSLIDSFVRNPDAFFTDKRIRLLTLPLKAHNGRIEQIVEIKFLTWCRLFNALHEKNICFDQIRIFDIYLQFCFGPLKEQSLYSWLPHGANEIAQGKKFPSLHLNSSKTFLQLFGLQKYIDEELRSKFTLLKFEGPKLSLKGFTQNPKLLIDSVGECCVLLSQLQNSDRFECAAISEALWKSLFDSVDGLTDELFKEKCVEQISALVIALAGVARKRSSLITFGLVPLFHIITSNEFKFFKHEKVSELIFIPLITTVMKKEKVLLQHDVVTIFKKIFMFKRNDSDVLPFIQKVLERFSLVKESIPADKIALLHNIWFSLEEELKHYLKMQKITNTNIDDKIYISSFCEFFIWPYMTVHHKFNQEKFYLKWTELYFLFKDNTAESLQIKLVVQILQNMRKLLPKSSNIVSIAQITHFLISNLDFSVYTEEKKADYTEIFTLIKSFLQSDNLKKESVKFFMSSFEHVFNASTTYPYCLLDPVLDSLHSLLVLHKNSEILDSIKTFLENFKEDQKYLTNLGKLRDILINASVDQNVINPIMQKNNVSIDKNTRKNILQIEKPLCASDSELTIKKRGRKSLFRSKESPELSTSIENIDKAIDNTEKNQIVALLGHDIETMTPIKLKGSLMTRKTKSLQTPEIKTPITVDDEEIVVNTPYKFNPKKLTAGQREKLARKRDDIPALYQDLSQSQTRDFGNSNSSLELTQLLEVQTKDQNKEKVDKKGSNPFSELVEIDKESDNKKTEHNELKTAKVLLKTTKTPRILLKPTEKLVKTTEIPLKTTEKLVKTPETTLKTTEKLVKTTETPTKTTEKLVKTTETPFRITEKLVKTTETQLKTTETPENKPKKVGKSLKAAETKHKSSTIVDTLLLKLKNVAAEKQLKAAEKRLNSTECLKIATETIDSQSKTTQAQPQTVQTKSKSAETKSKTAEIKSKSPETKLKTAETKSKTAEIKSKTLEIKSKTAETKSKTAETQPKITEMFFKIAEPELKTNEQRVESNESQLETSETQLETSATQLDTSATQIDTSASQLDAATKELETAAAQLETVVAQLETNALQFETTVPIKRRRKRRKTLNVVKRQSRRNVDSINELNVPNLLENSENSKENMTEPNSIVMRRLSSDFSSIEQDSNPLNTAKIEINSSDLNSGNIENIPEKIKAKRGRKRKNSQTKTETNIRSPNINETESDPERNVHTAKIVPRRRMSLGSVKKPEETSPLWSDDGSSDLTEEKRKRVNRELQRIKMDIKNNEEYMKSDKRKTRMSGTFHNYLDPNDIHDSDDSKSSTSTPKEDNLRNSLPDIPKNPKNLKTTESISVTPEITSVESENIIESSQQPEINIRQCKLPVLYPLEAVKPGELIAIGSGFSKTDIIKGPKPTSPFKILETLKIPPKSNICKSIVFPSYTPENFDKIARNFEKKAENLARKAESLAVSAENLSSSAENTKNSTKSIQNASEAAENLAEEGEVLFEFTVLEKDQCESLRSLKNPQTFENNNSETESINSEVLAQIISQNLETLTTTPSKSNSEDFSCRKVLFDSNSTENIEISDIIVLSPEPEQNTGIVTSPICSDTPTRNKELINNTSTLSPIKNLNFDDDILIIEDQTNSESLEKTSVNTEINSPEIIPQETSFNTPQMDPEPEKIIRDSPYPLKIRKKISLKSVGGRSAQMMGMVSARTRIMSPKRRKPKEIVKTTETFLSPTHNRIMKMMNQLEKNTEEEKVQEEPEEQIREEEILRFTKQLPLPSDTPSGSILKKRKLSPEAEESPLRLCKRRRVNFHDPPVSDSKYIINPRRKSELDQPRMTRSSSNIENNQYSIENINISLPAEILAAILPVPTDLPVENTANDSAGHIIDEIEKVDNDLVEDLIEKSCNEVSVITKNSDSLFSDPLPNAQEFLHDTPGTSRSLAESVLHWSPSKSSKNAQEVQHEGQNLGKNEDENGGQNEGQNEDEIKDVMGAIIEGVKEKNIDVQPLIKLMKLLLCQMNSDNFSEFLYQILETVPFKTNSEHEDSLPSNAPIVLSKDEQIQDVIKKLENNYFSRDLQGTLLNTLIKNFSVFECLELLGNEVKRKECKH